MSGGLKHNRVLLKITGEALKGPNWIFDKEAINFIAHEIKSAQGTQLIIVIGGGNIVRGSRLTKEVGVTEPAADTVGMLATMMNAVVLKDVLRQMFVKTRVLSAIEANKIAEPHIRERALTHLEKGYTLILAAGTGIPGVTTDTCAVLRASELGAEIVLKGTKVEGVYDKNPVTHPDAEFLSRLSYDDFLRRGLEQILDVTAVAQAKTKKMPIHVFNIFQKGNLLRVLKGENVGSRIA